MKNLVLFSLIILLAACKAGKPNGVLSEKEMENILYEYHLAKATASIGDSSEIKGRAYILSCLRNHGVNEAEFDSSMVWYFQHMEILQKVYQRINERYNRELASLGAATNEINRFSSLSSTGDTANIWNGASYYLLSGNGFNNHIAFEIEADTSFRPNDKYMLNFHAAFLQKEGRRHGIATLAVEYDNDSVGHTTQHFYGTRDNSLIIHPNRHAVKRVYGFIYMNSEWNVNPRLLFIFQPSLIRMRTISKPPAKETSVVADSAKTDSTSVKRDTIVNFNKMALSPDSIHSRPKPRKISQ